MGFLLLVIPIIALLLLFILKPKRLQHLVNVSSAVLLLIIAAILTHRVIRYGAIAYSSLGGFFYLDALSMMILDIVLTIGLMAAIFSIGYLEEEVRQGKLPVKKIRLYYMLMVTFIFTMVLALTVKNMGLMWIAIEATTLASAFLVGFYNNRYALEAAWKYVIICSVGIAVALLGIILLHLSSAGILESGSFLDWTALYTNAASLKSSVLRLAFIFILVGFGTKAGLAPMHTWLPDAHSQAPSPISAMLSGVLLNSAMYGIIRTTAIVNHNQGSSSFTGRLLIGIGILSIATAAVFILTQKDYKRLLAYSSIEHMGIIAVAIGIFTPLSVFGGLLHMINHSLTKSMLFLSAGNIMQKYDTKQIFKIKGILKTLPVSGTVFLLGLFAIAGTPPFSVFASEFSIIAAIFNQSSLWVGIVFILLLAIVFAGIAVTLFKMFYGKPDSIEAADPRTGEINIPGTICLAVLLVAVTAGGIYLPESVRELIIQAQGIILGTIQ
ncbi:Hydrogenase-4 component F [Dehalobacter sp. UNSWDHB]|jgi:Formate hydrogenlyase subunit 3/Multisubunit Na+/H+ antiporter, MnhD subunit|uniref:hydrogenase 4 subunit F n=1 Tax=unclassified Dehalobacter TaxID=2635733 RepID=UPI00028B25DC|nr:MULTISPECIES: hydrogenase 4 subunit F [unclassified Dehalobacter]AFV01732.1 Hydrogenase-4 component F [Dehalobacter sp. DCA]AFV04770.1 Hydrogenase-4 component F [Dehalobacter sp. CF]EQB21461.1 Hydrogenase-4 component F [Dehalobacter sp. UNSWDHB]